MISFLILPPQDQVVIHSCNIHILLKHMINASYDSINHYSNVHHFLIFRQTDPFRGGKWSTLVCGKIQTLKKSLICKTLFTVISYTIIAFIKWNHLLVVFEIFIIQSAVWLMYNYSIKFISHISFEIDEISIFVLWR